MDMDLAGQDSKNLKLLRVSGCDRFLLFSLPEKLTTLNRVPKKGQIQIKKEFFNFLANQIFCLLSVVLKVLPQHSHKPIVSSVLFPALSGLPAIFQDFLGATSLPHVGHFAINSPP
jgi:hypothetical protein